MNNILIFIIYLSQRNSDYHMDIFKDAAALLPKRIRSELLSLPSSITDKCEEIRLRTGRKLSIIYDGTEHDVTDFEISRSDIDAVLEKASGASVHAVESSIAKGFMYIEGGIRLGLCGTAVYKENGTFGIRDLSSLAIRIPHEIRDCGTEILEKLLSDGLCDIIIISPPGAGKTSCLREYVRIISDMSYRVSLIDERGEIAGVTGGVPQFDIGRHTDIMQNMPKREASIMMLRAMNPQLIAMDEISSPEDVKAIEEVAGCGVKILATAHAKDITDLKKRPVYKELLNMRIFRYAIIIENNNGIRRYRAEELT